MKTLVILLTLLFLNGCTTAGYFANRLHDGLDVLSLTAGIGVGAKVSVGPAYLNTFCIYHRDIVGLRYGDFISQAGESQDSEIGSWFGLGQSWHTRTKLQRSRDKAPEYLFTEIPFVMSRVRGAQSDPLALDIVLGFGPSVRFGINPLEITDFIFGWTTLDIVKDDVQRSNRK